MSLLHSNLSKEGVPPKMDFFLKNLRETLEAINKLIDNNINIVNTKRVRRCNDIKSSNRSKINFIWRSLKFLEEEGILELNGKTNPKTYKIKSKNRIDIDKFISEVER
ncbi:MAG: hypothetical protein BAJALOKI2v1_260028 [Promethearchaeota archaeon]|nr:MAG: hypothetical protein BAJALOKI2v1_260028 [Candidatus Lokiarchaeota archaeon]